MMCRIRYFSNLLTAAYNNCNRGGKKVDYFITAAYNADKHGGKLYERTNG